MSISRKLLRIWLTISSVIGFVAGWIFLSHNNDSETTTQIGSTTVEMPEIQAVPTVSGPDTNNVRTFSVNLPAFSPSLRTGGS